MLEFLSGFIIHFIQSTSYFGIFLLMTLGSAILPIPSEVVLPFSGFLVHSGNLSYFLVVLVAVLGDITGSLILYAIGYYVEERVIVEIIKKHGKYVLLSEHEYNKAAGWFKKYGERLVILGKLLPGLRFIISLPAGVFKMNVRKFVLFATIGSLIYTSIFVWIGVYLGNKWSTMGTYFHNFQLLIVILFLLAIIWYLDHKLHLRKKILRK